MYVCICLRVIRVCACVYTHPCPALSLSPSLPPPRLRVCLGTLPLAKTHLECLKPVIFRGTHLDLQS